MDSFEPELDSAADGSNNQGVYIYHPAKSSKPGGDRPSKRRKVERKDGENTQCPFVPLLNGDEDPAAVNLRYHTYNQLWSAQERKIQKILDDVDSEVLDNVSSFVRTTSPETYNGCIPAALVTVGSNVSSLSRLLLRLNDQLLSAEEGGVVTLESGDAPNLKTALKNIIRGAITNTEGNDGYQNFLNDRDGPRLLGYDLDLLSDYVKKRGVTKLVLALRDSEAFDPGLLTDLLSLLSSWLDRIPFTLLFGISTSVELFEERLPRSSVALIRGKYFESHEASNCVDQMYEKLQTRSDGIFWIGRNMTSALFERSSDFFQSPECFIRMVKYAYMSHFFANPLSLLLADDIPTDLAYDKLCEAIRNLPSFRNFCEELLDRGSANQARDLLEDNEALLRESVRHLEMGQQKMRVIFHAVKVIHRCLQDLNIPKRASISTLSIHALAGELLNSTIVEDIFATVKTLDSDGLKGFLAILPESVTSDSRFQQTKNDLDDLIQTYSDSRPLRSEYDQRNSVVKTTVVQQRVRLSKGKAKQPQQNIEYTKIVDRILAALESYLGEILVKPQDLFLHEVFLFDTRNPLKETFAPRPRFAVERALSSPFDYLISTAEERSGARVSTKQPATAILYQLYLESSALVNVHDLWHAFYAVFESGEGENCDEQMIMVLFYRALSELKAFGMIKNNRRNVDHVAKSAWLGL